MYTTFYHPLILASTLQILTHKITKVLRAATSVSDICLTIINSVTIVRNWFNDHGEDVVWAFLRTVTFLLMFVAVGGCYAVHSIRGVYRFFSDVWGWLNRATDDGLGLYGPSPMLWEMLTPTSTVDTSMPELKLAGDEVMVWVKERWPHLGA